MERYYFKTESSHMYTNTDQMASSMAMQEKKAVICIEAGDESYRGENRLYIEHNNIYLDRKWIMAIHEQEAIEWNITVVYAYMWIIGINFDPKQAMVGTK